MTHHFAVNFSCVNVWKQLVNYLLQKLKVF